MGLAWLGIAHLFAGNPTRGPLPRGARSAVPLGRSRTGLRVHRKRRLTISSRTPAHTAPGGVDRTSRVRDVYPPSHAAEQSAQRVHSPMAHPSLALHPVALHPT
jgi:hypothetical protein